MAGIKLIVDENILVNGCRVAYGIHGPSSGTPIILVHGTPSSSLIFRNVLPTLISANLKVHVFDLLGFGLSERPRDPDVDTSMTGQVSILKALKNHWNLETAHIVAHDIGGGIAQRFAALDGRDRVRTLTLVDCVSFDSYPSKRTREQMQNGLEALIKVDDDKHREHFREWLLSAVYHKERFASSSLGTFIEYISGPIGQASLFNHQVRHYDPKHTLEIVDKLGEVGEAMPVQLIWGENDEWQVTDWARKLQGAITGSELTILKECGHFSPEDQPEKVADLVIRFVERHGRGD